MKLIIDTDYCPVRNFDDVCSLCNCECISGEALTRDCPLIRNGGTPYNPTGDCISREALKEQINTMDFDFGDYYDNTETIIKLVCNVIDNAQAVCGNNPKWCEHCVSKGKCASTRSHGEWKHIGGDEWVCSECGHVITTEGSWENPLSTGAYHCENCGADMRPKGGDPDEEDA